MQTLPVTAVMALVLLSACSMVPISGTGTTAGGNGSGGVTTASGNVAADIITYTNQQRARNGLPAFTTSAKLMDAANLHVRQMAQYQKLAHDIPGATYPNLQSRLQSVGYVYVDAAENVAWNQQSAQAAVASWMGSAGHRANILDASLTQIGAAMARSSKGEPYWIQVFATPR
jgi:uncharacterized protein YkwD